jgi:hypothetical protein
VEPGRGTIYSSAENDPYFIMTNFSLCDFKNGNVITDSGYDRYNIVQSLLDNRTTLDVKTAFKVLEATKQVGEWNTEFSMVYSRRENAVYYCLHGDFDDVIKYSFAE